MTKALVTFGIGPYTEILEQTRPLFVNYAAKHGYEYLEPRIQEPPIRPASWLKVPSLIDALQRFDDVLWLDCDVVILDNTVDLLDAVPQEVSVWQSMVLYRRHMGINLGEVPGCGTWHVRKPMIPVLEGVWNLTEFINKPWWEQAAMHVLMGYEQQGGDLVFPVVRKTDTELYNHTFFLPLTWGSTDYTDLKATPNFMHIPGGIEWRRRMESLAFWIAKSRQL